jgi:hypothetical protein
MKRGQKTMMGLLSLTLGLVLAVPPVKAEPAVTVIPSSLTVVGTQCPAFFNCPPIERQLLIQTNQAIANLKILSLDLNRTDGATVVPATVIRPILTASSVQPNQPLTVLVQFDLSVAHSGEYSGVLLAVYSDGQLTVPVIVRVKDHWLWPLLVLLLGVGVGIGVSAYRTEGRNRDEIVVQVGRIRTQIKADPELAKSFQLKIDGNLIEVETALTNKRWEQAQQAVVQAQAVYDKWRKGREDWLALIKSLASLKNNIEELNNPHAPYVETVRTQLENIERQASDKDSPQQLSEDLINLRQQLVRYLQGQAKVNQFDTLRNELTELAPEEDKSLRRISQSLQQELDSLSPTDPEAFKTWQHKIEDQINKIDQMIKQQQGKEEGRGQLLITARGFNDTEPYKLPDPVPDARPLQLNPMQASRNLIIFNWIGYGIAVILLAGAGFGQLYIAQSTFGANRWTDYFSLLAWGFGAEATRDAITKVVRDFKLPGLN